MDLFFSYSHSLRILSLSASVFSHFSGDAFGPRTPVILQLLELPGAMQKLEGVEMELRDCAFPNLKDIILTDKPEVAFANVDYALLVGVYSLRRIVPAVFFPSDSIFQSLSFLQLSHGLLSVTPFLLSSCLTR